MCHGTSWQPDKVKHRKNLLTFVNTSSMEKIENPYYLKWDDLTLENGRVVEIWFYHD